MIGRTHHLLFTVPGHPMSERTVPLGAPPPTMDPIVTVVCSVQSSYMKVNKIQPPRGNPSVEVPKAIYSPGAVQWRIRCMLNLLLRWPTLRNVDETQQDDW